MHPPLYDQVTCHGHLGPTVECPDEEYCVRAEEAPGTDINRMLTQYGVLPPQREPIFGEWDDTLDLQTALATVNEARAAYAALPPEERQRIGSWSSFLHVAEQIIMDQERKAADAAKAAASPPNPNPATAPAGTSQSPAPEARS